jgi:GxxExxY protein
MTLMTTLDAACHGTRRHEDTKSIMLINASFDTLSETIIGCGIEVHRHLGPGLLESIYESALCIELRTAGLSFQRQVSLPLWYKGELLGEHRPDLIVGGQLVVEVKSIERLAPVHIAQMLTYLRVAQLRVGLILNFNSAVLRSGIKRVLL